jgi:hypothetical protein
VFRKSILIVALLLGALWSPGVAHATTGACAVTPNPDPVGTPYTVAATGLTVNTAFTVHIHQAGYTALDLIVASDANGAASTGPVAWGSTGPQAPGTASVSWKKYQTQVGGGGSIGSYGPTEAACDWAIVA